MPLALEPIEVDLFIQSSQLNTDDVVEINKFIEGYKKQEESRQHCKTNLNWNNIQWMFEPDGSLLDIYVKNATLEDWSVLIDLINDSYYVRFDGNTEETPLNQIDKDYVFSYWKDVSGKRIIKSASINLNAIDIQCCFFEADQIELFFDPKDVSTHESYQILESFMEEISKTLKKEVILTGENSIETPLIMIDVENNIKIAVEELKEY